VLLVLLVVFTISALMGWLARSRHLPTGQPTTILVHPRSVGVVGAFFTSLLILAAALSFKAPTGGPIVALLFLGFAVLSSSTLLDYFVTRFEILPEGLRFRSPLRGSGMASWHTMTRVSWSRVGKWFIIRLSAGRPVRISAMLRGLPAFAVTLLRELPRYTFDDEAHALLEATARGELPKFW
jgi:hypothetical protein